MWYIYTTEYYTMTCADKWMKPEVWGIIPTDVTQTRKKKYGIYLLICGY